MSGRSSHSSTLLDGANDWQILVDFENQKLVFPSEIYSTPQRPDIIIWSKKLHKVYLVELTCPAEEGIEAAAIRKDARYSELASDINNNNDSPWSAVIFTIEAGARGFVARSCHVFLRKLGFASASARKICKNVSLITTKCSYELYLARSRRSWYRNRDLLALEL